MMLQIMVYAIVMAAALSAAGLCLERLATLWGLPRRGAWIVALLFSVCGPPLMILSARPHLAATFMPAYSAPPAYIGADMPSFSDTASAPTETAATARLAPPPDVRWNLSALFSDRNLLTTWAVISLTSALYLLAAQLRLRRRVASWRQATLLDQTVLISEATGPALAGVFPPRLVIPRWLLDEPPTTQLLVLEHERQHLAAYDPLLIRATTLLLAAFPWNLPLWWQFRRMRRAIELDCDARVLRTGVAAQTYGEVLICVVERAARMPMGAIAMSEPVSALERRIQNLVPDPVKHVSLQARAVLLVLALSVGTALAIDAPAIPRRAAVQTTTPDPSPEQRISAMGAAAPAAAIAGIAQPGSGSFTVRILPKASMSAARAERWSRINAALAARLHRIPGLKLLTADANDAGAAEYELKIISSELSNFTIVGKQLKAPPRARSPLAFRDTTGRMNSFLSHPRDDNELAGSIDNSVTSMQLRFFPRDAAVDEQLLTRVADPKSRPEERAMVLSNLLANSERNRELGPGLRFPPASNAVLSAAVNFASTQSDARQRLVTWTELRQINAPGLHTPVIAALRKETDTQVRLVLISMLALNFSSEPQARATLESIARTDKRQVARMAAQRALSGDAGWNEYVLATLKNARLTDTQRLEPLTYPGFPDQYLRQKNPLDGEGARIVGTLLERAEAFSNEVALATDVLARSPAANGALAELLRVRELRQVLFDVRNRLLSAQTERLPLDDSGRALLEDIAKRDSDWRIREAARSALFSVHLRETDGALWQRHR